MTGPDSEADKARDEYEQAVLDAAIEWASHSDAHGRTTEEERLENLLQHARFLAVVSDEARWGDDT